MYANITATMIPIMQYTYDLILFQLILVCQKGVLFVSYHLLQISLAIEIIHKISSLSSFST